MTVELVPIEHADDERLAPFRLNERGLASRANKRADAGSGLFLAEGAIVVERALEAGCRPHRALADGDRIPAVAEQLGIDVFVGGDEVRRLVTGLGMPHSIVVLFHRPPRPTALDLIARTDRLVIVEGVDNPANVGSIVRNAAGLGWGGLLLDHTSADPLARRALRVAMGTAFALPHARTNDLPAIVAGMSTHRLFALTPSADAADIRSIDAGPGPRAVLIGAERSGLSDAVLAHAVQVRIPMSAGVDSLNAAAAAAIACFVLANE